MYNSEALTQFATSWHNWSLSKLIDYNRFKGVCFQFAIYELHFLMVLHAWIFSGSTKGLSCVCYLGRAKFEATVVSQPRGRPPNKWLLLLYKICLVGVISIVGGKASRGMHSSLCSVCHFGLPGSFFFLSSSVLHITNFWLPAYCTSLR